MTLKNLGPFKFKPSTVVADYAITGADTTGQGINPNSSVSTCLSGAELDVNGTCDIVLNVTSGAVTDDYATVYNSGASSNTNLAADPTVDTYSITNQDAYIAWFKDDASDSANRITDVTANIQLTSGVAQTFVIKNIGEKPLAFAATGVTSNSEFLTFNADSDDMTLGGQDSCTVVATVSRGISTAKNKPQITRLHKMISRIQTK